jgi:ubiquinone/menaquinone biosynthesis C-methylase UbiE
MSVSQPAGLKRAVERHWNDEACGTRGVVKTDRKVFFDQIECERYKSEPYIRSFAQFQRGRGKKLLEIGVGAGTDFVNWVRNGAQAVGIDLTETGVKLTRERLALEGLIADVMRGDAECLPFKSNTFDIVYSYGVLHHSPDTAEAVQEVHRVLKPGGEARIMIYHVPSCVALMLWTVHCLLKGRPWRSPRWAVYHHLESPGTKAYTVKEARRLFASFATTTIRLQLTFGDLLLMRPSTKYQNWSAKLIWFLYPRWLLRLTRNRFGTGLLIEARK